MEPQHNSDHVMSSLLVDTKPETVRHGLRHYLATIRDWPANGNSPYSPVFCVALLLAIGLIIEIGR